jgi:hypothetical protein
MIYDIFYVSKQQVDVDGWQQFRQRFPSAQKIDNVRSIDDVKKKSFTKFFWLVWDDQEILEDFNFDYRVEKWDEQYIHTFKTLYKDVEYYRGGVCLIPKNLTVSQKEFDFKFFINKKEISKVVSKFKFTFYKKYHIDSYKKYLDICSTEIQPLFWCIWNDIEIIDDSIFDLHFDPNDGKYDYDRSINHVYKNLCNGIESYISGLTLFSTKKIITEKEFKFRFPIDKKEYDLIVSKHNYPRYTINNYQEYLDICNRETRPLFWGIWNDINITNDSVFDLYFDLNDGKYDYDRGINHTFKNNKYYDGLMLMSKEKILTEKEFKYRFPIEKKEWDIVASMPKPYDVVFISYNEPNADANYEKLKLKRPDAKRVHGVKGIHNAHIAAAKLATTEMFWVVDADAELVDNFNFSTQYFPHYDSGNRLEKHSTVWVWSSKNPVNGLVYGYGGVKLLPTTLTLEMDTATADMTTSISSKFKAVKKISNITAFNTDEFSTWRSAFRECVKLASRVIDNTYDEDTEMRLMVWCSTGRNKPFGEYAIAGAKAGKEFGTQNVGNLAELVKINDFDWLREKFNEQYKQN